MSATLPISLILPFYDNRKNVDLENIVCLTSHRNYTEFRFISGKSLLVSTTLKRYEELLLASPYFYRISRSCIINIKHITNYEGRRLSAKVTLLGGYSFEFSRRRIEGFSPPTPRRGS